MSCLNSSFRAVSFDFFPPLQGVAYPNKVTHQRWLVILKGFSRISCFLRLLQRYRLCVSCCEHLPCVNGMWRGEYGNFRLEITPT